jgi:hypothetical protein
LLQITEGNSSDKTKNMKLKSIIFSTVLLFASMAKSNAQTAQHDSLRIQIMENKNGNMFMIDTVVPASQHDQLVSWLSTQGIELPGMPEGHDSVQVEIIKIEGDGDSLPNGMRIIQPPTPPNAPLPPPAPGQKIEIIGMPPPPPGKNCRMIIICDSTVTCDKMKKQSDNTTTPEQGKVIVKNAPDGKALTIFPNPSNGHITVNIDIAGKEKTNMTITDMTGKTVYNEQLGTETENLSKEIDLSKFGKGTYAVKVEKGGQVFIRNVVVQ